ncbi:MAG: hypothetical protein VX543_00335, partial [Cyanobacteriota bacterium]|nr:hypothetical protein [Cyanobacteriota bacterium]
VGGFDARSDPLDECPTCLDVNARGLVVHGFDWPSLDPPLPPSIQPMSRLSCLALAGPLDGISAADQRGMALTLVSQVMICYLPA